MFSSLSQVLTNIELNKCQEWSSKFLELQSLITQKTQLTDQIPQNNICHNIVIISELLNLELPSQDLDPYQQDSFMREYLESPQTFGTNDQQLSDDHQLFETFNDEKNLSYADQKEIIHEQKKQFDVKEINQTDNIMDKQQVNIIGNRQLQNVDYSLEKEESRDEIESSFDSEFNQRNINHQSHETYQNANHQDFVEGDIEVTMNLDDHNSQELGTQFDTANEKQFFNNFNKDLQLTKFTTESSNLNNQQNPLSSFRYINELNSQQKGKLIENSSSLSFQKLTINYPKINYPDFF